MKNAVDWINAVLADSTVLVHLSENQSCKQPRMHLEAIWQYITSFRGECCVCSHMETKPAFRRSIAIRGARSYTRNYALDMAGHATPVQWSPLVHDKNVTSRALPWPSIILGHCPLIEINKHI